jgi:hypothetical protein
VGSAGDRKEDEKVVLSVEFLVEEVEEINLTPRT